MFGSRRLLQYSAWVLILMGLAHLAGHISGMKEMTSPPDEKTRVLVEAMRNYRLPDWPVERTVEGLYAGFSLSMSGYAIFVGALLLVGLKAAGDDAGALRRLAIVMSAGTAILLAISMIYFILPPTTFLLVAFVLAAAGAARA